MDSSATKPESDDIGKDEMNLLEYCLFSATNRVDRKTTSLVFEDRVRSPEGGEYLPKRLTVAFSAEYGRPTARDDLVMTAWMKLTRDAGFESPKVEFTRYEILAILGWRDEGSNYRRIEDAFDRIRGMHLSWENAYWDHREKDWVTRKFSIIDDAAILDRRQYKRIHERSGERRPRSWFKWSDVLYESFQAGYIKTLDMAVLRAIDGDVAKRLYRWLDKHFKNPKRRLPIEIPLETLAEQKLGFKPAKPSHLIRMLLPSIDELVKLGHLQGDASRFGEKYGTTVVKFRPGHGRKRKEKVATPQREPSGLEKELLERDVRNAVQLVATYPEERIRKQIENFDDRTSKGEELGGAWLRRAIEAEDGFSYRKDYQTPDEREAEARKQREAQRRREEAVQQKLKEEAERAEEFAARTERVDSYLESLSAAEREQVEEAAVNSDQFVRQLLGKHGKNSVFMRTAVQRYVEGLLEQQYES